ncbi:hypothetical protein GCM10025783_19560 [Amnibacterium soli]|uniref:Uncharacterized protein n=2 Tax=Amnibacterium soli TaxID=1282736 RepID=A0ABP8Z606_9MICO
MRDRRGATLRTMTPFDPETGMRVEEAPAAGATAARDTRPRRQPNPFLLALTAIWLLAGASGLLAWRTGVGTDAVQGDPIALLLATICVLTAVAAGVAHLAVLAVGWRPPEE